MPRQRQSSLSIPLPRPPLETAPNGLRSLTTPSPPFQTAKSNLPKLRRKRSLRAFHPNVDSSESIIPSPHDSIWEASLQTSDSREITPPRTSNDAWKGPLGDLPTFERSPTPKRRVTPNSNEISPSSFWFNKTIHYPHLLETITEQKSIATLRSSLSHKSSIRRLSFSLPSSLPSCLPSHPEDDKPSCLPHLNPHIPLHPAPYRSPTPQGLPTFNTPAAANYVLPSPRSTSRVVGFFRRDTSDEKEWRRQTENLPRGVVMRGEDGVLIRGRFRPLGGGGHAGREMERHPWIREDVRVREEEKRAERLQVAEREPVRREEKAHSGWWDKLCFICCGVEMGDEEEVGVRVVRRAVGEGTMENVAPVSRVAFS